MNICAKISNPMALTDIAFSERAYGASFLILIYCVVCVYVEVSLCLHSFLKCLNGYIHFQILFGHFDTSRFLHYLQLRLCTTTAKLSAPVFIPTTTSAIL